MNFVAVEAPTPRVPTAREALELLNTALRIVVGEGLQVISDHLVEALA
jgi:hypothetical protein